MQSERIEQRALNKGEKRGHLRCVQHEFPVLSPLLVRRGDDNVRVPAALGSERNDPLGVARDHAPATEGALDLFRGRDFAEVEEDLYAQRFRAEEVCVDGNRQGTQAAGWVQE